MSLDDLRARMHALNKTLAGAAVEANEITVALQNYSPDPVPPPPVPVSVVSYARLIYNDPNIDGRHALQVLQGQPATLTRMADLRKAGAKRLLRYTHAMTRTPNDKGARQAYGNWTDAWLARSSAGQPIVSTKFRSGPNNEDPNMLIDVGLAEYQQESARYLINKCLTERWDGVYFDEINQRQAYAGYTVPAKYGTDEAFQQATLAYVTYLAKTLKQAGFSCHINLGSDYNDWAKAITLACDGQHIEYFIAQRSLGRVASDAEWRRQLDWLTWNEQQGREAICQADARTAGEVVYSLATWLLAANKAKFAAMNDRKYGAGGAWWVPEMDTALKLGAPLGTWTLNGGIYSRKFEHGVVAVNPLTGPINTMPATSGLIQLT